MSITTAVQYAAQKGVVISDRALRNAVAEGRLLAENIAPDGKKPQYVTTETAMNMFLLRRRRKNTRMGT